jgi:two-component system sensor histidine kinase/response regulator
MRAVNSPALDLATLEASPQQRRTALVVIAALGAITLAAAPFARDALGTFPGFVTLYGGAVMVGLAITTTILFGQYAVSRRPSLLMLSCATLFSAIIFVPYIFTFPGVGTDQRLGATPDTSTYLWAIWHTALPLAFLAYPLLEARRRHGAMKRGTATAIVIASVLAAYTAIHLVFAFDEVLPWLHAGYRYSPGLYVVMWIDGAAAGAALILLLRRAEGTIIDAWLTVPTAALLWETLINALGGKVYSTGWYLARVDVLVATSFLVIALLSETNRLAHGLAANERRMRGIVNGVADALIVVDARGLIASVNPAAASLFGFGAFDLIGTPVTRILPDFTRILLDHEGVVAETTACDAGGVPFPIELARGRDAARGRGETILILRDITQRKQAEDAIRAAHDRAIEAVNVKAQFLATMSHEIRTPINAVVGMSELLLQTALSEEAREYATIVRDSAESLLVIVNDILDFSKIEAGRMELDDVPFSPIVAVENATDILAAAARKKGLALSTYVAPEVPRRVLGDADRLRQVLLNLIGNAVKFTAHGSVMVRAVVEREEGERCVLRFSIADTGPGIAPEVSEYLFEPFRQADQSTSRRFGGTGLGLSISRRIVELMGGRIGFDSTPGRGTTFWFTIPFNRGEEEAEREDGDGLRGARILVIDEDAVARATLDQYLLAWGASASSTGNAPHGLELAKEAAARANPFDAIVVDRLAGGDGFAFATRLLGESALARTPLVLLSGSEERITMQEARAHGFAAVLRKPIRQSATHDVVVDAMRGPVPPRSPRPAHVAADALIEQRSGITVLVAEDNPVNRKLALQQLKKLGYGAHAVADGREAIDAFRSGGYDLILMDCQMPEIDGFEATREIRRIEERDGRHTPIVAMTANTLEGDRDACLAAGMDGYLPKPVQLSALRAVIDHYTTGVGVAG